MPEPTYAAIGHFCWAELASTDLAASLAFYVHLFGWETFEVPGAFGHYTLLRRDGMDATAAYQMGPEQTSRPRWNSYVAVRQVDKTAAKAEKLGARIVLAPIDVADAGRMAVVQDPGGARLCLWQSGSHFGAGVFGRPGSLCWTELSTRDPQKALAFYGGLFGWEGEIKPQGEFTYTDLWLDGVPVGGMLGMGEQAFEHMPEQWTPYFAVGDCDGAVRRAESRGATLLTPPADIPGVGRFAALRDPLGATFSVLRLQEK
ncbi:MAG TPA: VOC family protein [Holophagaceae bacterium]|nr:VOC family protein [Holophagaceae bacterium]